MTSCQPAVLAPLPAFARFLEFTTLPDRDPAAALRALAALDLGDNTVVGLGPALVRGVGGEVAGLRPFPAMSGPGCEVPSTQADLWIWVHGDDRGRVLHRARELTRGLDDTFARSRLVNGFKFADSLDLTGYEDGTENPEGEDAVAAAIAPDGSSFVAVQQWLHDLDHFQSLPQADCDDIFGRRLSDNEEFDEAPVSAHVKRTAQESFTPEAFILRRSMPWADPSGEGLVFVAFGHTPDAFEAILARMTGQEDGVIDGLFRFTRPLSGSYFWCPPMADGRLSLAAIGF